MRICIDIDGVVADPGDPWRPYHEREPYPHAVEYVRKLRERGAVIVFQTARYMGRCEGNQARAHDKGYSELVGWLDKHGIPYDEVYLGKVSADYYLDDRAVPVRSANGNSDWEHVLRMVRSR